MSRPLKSERLNNLIIQKKKNHPFQHNDVITNHRFEAVIMRLYEHGIIDFNEAMRLRTEGRIIVY